MALAKRTYNINNISLKNFFDWFIIFSAVADTVRTSLGPKGMDKMVRYYSHLQFFEPNFPLAQQNN